YTTLFRSALIEGIPAAAGRSLAEALEIGVARLGIEDVVLARRIMHVELGAADHLLRVVEFVRLGRVADVAGMDHERRLVGHRYDLIDRYVERSARVRIGGLGEADMAVGHLDEGKAALRRFRRADQTRSGHAAGDRPDDAGSGPQHAFQGDR